MTVPKFADSILNGIHHDLKQLAGNWKGLTRVWFEPGKLADESAFRGVIRSVLGGRFIQFEYTGAIQGSPVEGIMTMGCSLGTGQLQCAWIDSFHNGTAIMFSENNGTSFPFSVRGSYGKEPKWGWRTELTPVDDRHFVITMYNITPDGDEAKAVEMSFERSE